MAKKYVKILIITNIIIISSLTSLATENIDLHSFLRDSTGENPINNEKIDLKLFNCFDYPDLVEGGICWCGTEDLLDSKKLKIKKIIDYIKP